MVRPSSSRARIALALAGSALFATLLVPGGAAAAACLAPPPMTFSEPSYVDTERAGGEPMIATHPDGTLLYGAHAGTTHFYTPAAPDADTAAFVQHYTGQVYIWRSVDNGATWEFIPRELPENLPGSGFSDPDFAIDTAGNVYVSEINLLNVSMSRSTDDGRSFESRNFFAQTMTDRQWSEADTQGVIYLVGNSFAGGTVPSKPAGNFGHYLYKSKDGGKTFTPGTPDGGGLGDLRVDKSDGTLYEAHFDDGKLEMAIFRRARADDLRPTKATIATGVDMLSHWPAFDLDPEGNLYIVWDESGRGRAKRAAGIWYSYSTTRGMTWSPPVRVDTDNRTDIWPWLAVGDTGRVGVAWFEASEPLPGHNAETKGEHGWRVAVAQSLTGLGCDESPVPAFTVSVATREPLHAGTVCQGGTICQARLVDRRLGDYFSVEVDGTGRFVAAYSDTRRGGAVALPAFVRQSGGASFFAEDAAGTEVRGTRLSRRSGTDLPRTGASVWPALGLMLTTAAAGIYRWNRGGR